MALNLENHSKVETSRRETNNYYLYCTRNGFSEKEWDTLVIIFLANPFPLKVGKDLHGWENNQKIALNYTY